MASIWLRYMDLHGEEWIASQIYLLKVHLRQMCQDTARCSAISDFSPHAQPAPTGTAARVEKLAQQVQTNSAAD